MSYSGSKEFLCQSGHYSRVDCWSDDLTECRFCKAPITHRHSIDSTNGEIEGEPATMPAAKQQVGYDDRWHEDHYGNRYAIKIPRWVPGSIWRCVEPPAS